MILAAEDKSFVDTYCLRHKRKYEKGFLIPSTEADEAHEAEPRRDHEIRPS